MSDGSPRRAPGPVGEPLETVCAHALRPVAVVSERGARGVPTVRHSNRAFATLVAGGARAIIEQPVHVVLEALGECDANVVTSLRAGRSFRTKIRSPAAAKGRAALELDFQPLRDRDGQQVGWLVAAALDADPAPARPRVDCALLDQLGHGVVIHRSFTPLYANHTAARFLGYGNVGELLRCPSMLVHLPVEWHARTAQHHSQILAGHEPRRPRWFPCFTQDGALFWLEAVARRVDWDGGPAEMLSLSDVTEQVSSRGTEMLLREAVDNLFDTFVLYDADERVVLSNRRFHQAFPFFPPQDRIQGTKMAELVRLAVRNDAVRDARAYSDPESWIRDFVQWRRENDSTLTEDNWPDGRWDLVQEQHTRSGGFVSVRTDITERKRAEAALRESEARLERALEDRTAQLEGILENIEQGITIIGPDHRVVLANQGFARIYGLPEALTRPGTHVSEYIRFRIGQGRRRESEPDDASLEALIARRLRQYDEMTREHTLDHLVDGRVIDVHRQRLPNGTIVSTHTDVTERIEADRELQRQRDALNQSEKMSALGTLLAGVAHELNNPLSVVVGVGTLLEQQLTGRQGEQAARVRAAAERCARIVRTFLAMARQRSTVHAPTQLNELVRRALDLLAYQLRSAGIEVGIELDPELPEIDADPDQLTQVLVNLVVNAQQAMMDGEGPRRLAIRTRLEHGERRLLVEVSDSGPGVPEDLRGRIFEPFFTTKAHGVGTGIGLAVCHGMVSGHGGHIDVGESDDGGARFVVTLPGAASASRPDQDGDQLDGGAVCGAVLVVDDEPEVREYIAEVLAMDGHDVDEAGNGVEALARIRDRAYAAIVCDLRMPEMDGPALFAQLQGGAPELAERIVFLTGDLLGGHAEAFLESSGRPFLEKPATSEQLRRLVRSVIVEP